MEETQLMNMTQDMSDDSNFENIPTSLVGWLLSEGLERPINNGSIKIGRDPSSCSIVFHDKKTISKEHAVIQAENNSVTLMDLGSRNRTRINKIFLKPHVYYGLIGGEKIHFGDVECIFQLNKQNNRSSDEESDSILHDVAESAQHTSKQMKGLDISTDDSFYINPTPQPSTSIFPSTSCTMKNPSPSMPATLCPTNEPSNKILVPESPSATQSTPISKYKKRADGPVETLSPILNKVDSSLNGSSFIVGPTQPEKSATLNDQSSKADYGSDNSTDIEDFFTEEKDSSSKKPSKSLDEGSFKGNLDIFTAPTQVFNEKDSEQKDKNVDLDDIFSMATQIFDCNEEEMKRAKNGSTKTTEELSKLSEQQDPQSDEEDIFNLPTQKFSMNVKTNVVEDVFTMPTQIFKPNPPLHPDVLDDTDIFDAPTQQPEISPPYEKKHPTDDDEEEDIFAMPTQVFKPPHKKNFPTEEDTATQQFILPESIKKTRSKSTDDWRDSTQDVLKAFETPDEKSSDRTQDILEAFDTFDSSKVLAEKKDSSDPAVARDLYTNAKVDDIYDLQTQNWDESISVDSTQIFDPTSNCKEAEKVKVDQDFNDNEETQIFDEVCYVNTDNISIKVKDAPNQGSINKAGIADRKILGESVSSDQILNPQSDIQHELKNKPLNEQIKDTVKPDEPLSPDSDGESDSSETLLMNIVDDTDGPSLNKNTEMVTMDNKNDAENMAENEIVQNNSSPPTPNNLTEDGFNSDESTDVEDLIVKVTEKAEEMDSTCDYSEIQSPIFQSSYDIFKDPRLLSSDEETDVSETPPPVKNSNILAHSDQKVGEGSQPIIEESLVLFDIDFDTQDLNVESGVKTPKVSNEEDKNISSCIKKANRSLIDSFNDSFEKKSPSPAKNESQLPLLEFEEERSQEEKERTPSPSKPLESDGQKSPLLQPSCEKVEKEISHSQSNTRCPEQKIVSKQDQTENAEENSVGLMHQNLPSNITENEISNLNTHKKKELNSVTIKENEGSLGEAPHPSPIVESKIKNSPQNKTPTRRNLRHSKRHKLQISNEQLHAIQEENSLCSTKDVEIEIRTTPRASKFNLDTLFFSPRTEENDFSGFDNSPVKESKEKNILNQKDQRLGHNKGKEFEKTTTYTNNLLSPIIGSPRNPSDTKCTKDNTELSPLCSKNNNNNNTNMNEDFKTDVIKFNDDALKTSCKKDESIDSISLDEKRAGSIHKSMEFGEKEKSPTFKSSGVPQKLTNAIPNEINRGKSLPSLSLKKSQTTAISKERSTRNAAAKPILSDDHNLKSHIEVCLTRINEHSLNKFEVSSKSFESTSEKPEISNLKINSIKEEETSATSNKQDKVSPLKIKIDRVSKHVKYSTVPIQNTLESIKGDKLDLLEKPTSPRLPRQSRRVIKDAHLNPIASKVTKVSLGCEKETSKQNIKSLSISENFAKAATRKSSEELQECKNDSPDQATVERTSPKKIYQRNKDLITFEIKKKRGRSSNTEKCVNSSQEEVGEVKKSKDKNSVRRGSKSPNKVPHMTLTAQNEENTDFGISDKKPRRVIKSKAVVSAGDTEKLSSNGLKTELKPRRGRSIASQSNVPDNLTTTNTELETDIKTRRGTRKSTASHTSVSKNVTNTETNPKRDRSNKSQPSVHEDTSNTDLEVEGKPKTSRTVTQQSVPEKAINTDLEIGRRSKRGRISASERNSKKLRSNGPQLVVAENQSTDLETEVEAKTDRRTVLQSSVLENPTNIYLDPGIKPKRGRSTASRSSVPGNPTNIELETQRKLKRGRDSVSQPTTNEDASLPNLDIEKRPKRGQNSTSKLNITKTDGTELSEISAPFGRHQKGQRKSEMQLPLPATKRSKRKHTNSTSSIESSISHSSKRPVSPLSPAKSLRSSRRGQSPISDLDILFSPSQRQAMASAKPRVLFTSYTDKKDEKIVKDAGGRVVDSAAECSILVAVGIRRTCKLLSAIARGVPVVAPAWVAACKKANSFVEPSQYLIVDKESEKKFGFNLKKALLQASQHRLLTGYSIHATNNVKPPPDQMREIIECAGGEYLEMAPKIYTPSIVIISCEEDKRLWNKFTKLKIPVVNAEFILTGLLKQKIMIKENLLVN